MYCLNFYTVPPTNKINYEFEFICQRICIRKQGMAKAAYVYESSNANNTNTSSVLYKR